MLGTDFKSVPASAAVPAVPGGVLAEDVGGQSKISGEILTLTPDGLGGLGGKMNRTGLITLLSLAWLLAAPQAAYAQSVTLTASDVTETTATITLTNHDNTAWYYKGNQNGATCTSVNANTTTASLANLTGGTSYTYKAYSDSACTTEITSGTTDAEFTTVGLSAGTPGQNSATLTLSNWTAAWWHKKTSGPGTASCASVGANTGTASLSGLTAGSSYTWEVYKAANCGATDKIADVSFTTPPVALAASNLDQTTATITMSGYGADWYYKGNQSGATCTSVVAGKYAVNLTGLTANTSYTYKVYSDSSCATELTTATSDVEFTTTAAAVPDAPAKPSVSGGNARVRLSWITPDNNGAAITGYKYQQKTGTGQWGSWTAISNSATATSHIITTLTNGTNYQFKVRAVNSAGDGGESPASNTVTPASRTLSSADVGATTATLTLSSPAEDWYYKYTAPATPAGTCSSPQTGARASATGLVPAASNTLKAYGDRGCTFELATASAFLTKPGQVQGLTATAGAGQLSLAWTALTGTVTGYKVQWKSGNESYNTSSRQTTVSGGTSNSATISNLAAGISHTVRVTAYNATGDGAASAEATGTPTGKTLTVSKITKTTATLTIADHTGNWYYKYTVPTTPAGTCSSVQSTSSADLTNLLGGTSYTFRAYSDSSCSTWLGSEVTFTTLAASVPPAPSQPAVSGATSGQVTITWTSSGDGGSAITSWEYQQKAGAGQWGSWTTVPSSGASTRTYTVQSLTNNTEYKFKVRAVNSAGNGAASPESFGATPGASVPSAPSNLRASSQNRQISLLWFSPISDGGSPIIRHEYLQSDGVTWGTDWKTITDAPPGAVGGSVTGLTNGVLYAFKVRGVNAVGNGAESPSSGTIAPGATPPLAPELTLLAGDRQVKLSWVSGGDGGSAITSWEYQRTTGDNPAESWTTIPNSGATTTSYTVTNLVNGTQYKFRVRAVSGNGNGTASLQSAAVTPGLPTLTSSAVTKNTATLTIGRHDGNWYYKYTTPSGGECSAVQTGAIVNLTNLTGGTSYTYKAYSDSSCSTVLATASAFTTSAATAPAAPAKPSVAHGNASVTLTWTAPNNNGAAITRYEYAYKTTGDYGSWTAIPNSASLTTYKVTGLTNGTAHTFKLRAVNSAGNGADSPDSDSVTPFAPVTVSALSPSTVPEGGSATYTVVLGMAPTSDVSVAIANRGQTGDDASLTAGPTTLTFTSSNWSTKQTVTVSAAQDLDTLDGTAVLTHTATSTDTNFNNIVANLSVTEDDDDTIGLMLSKTALTVPEGGSATYTIRANTLPTHDVTVNFTTASGSDGDLTVDANPTRDGDQSSLIITTKGWDLPRTITVRAAEDNDTANGTATINHTAISSDTNYNGATIPSVVATESDNDSGLVISASALQVPEGSTGTYTVALATVPSASVTVTLGAEDGGDSDLTFSPATLAFTTSNWSTAQTVTVTAAEDADDSAGTKVITHTASSADSAYNNLPVGKVTVRESDNEDKGIVLSASAVTVAEGASASWTIKLTKAPTSNVTVTVASRGGTNDDTDITLDAAPYSTTFTTTTWNTAATVTVSAAQDDDKTDGQTVFVHTASGGGFGGATASVTVTENDDDATNASPTSRNFSFGVSRDRRSSIELSNFPFTDADAADTLGRVRIVTLPPAADGTLGTVLTGIKAAAVTGCVGDIQAISAGQEIVNELRKVLYFCPKTGFSSTSFQFKVIDSRGQESGRNYTATLIGPPGQVTGLSGDRRQRLREPGSWTDPKNSQRQRLRVPAEDDRQLRGLDRYERRRGDDHQLFGEFLDQQHRLHLPGAGEDPGRDGAGVGGGDGDADFGGARQAHRASGRGRQLRKLWRR